METAALILTIIMMLAGLAGTILPVIPSVPLIYAGYAIYGFATHWRDYQAGVMLAMGAITVMVMVLDYLAGALGAKKFGASWAGVWGSVIGAVAGFVFFNIPGLILGPFVGALAGELCLGRRLREALVSGWGAFLGFLAGSLLKIVVAIAMIGAFVYFAAF